MVEAALGLGSCASAVAAGDGRDLFSLQAGGQLLNVAGGKCVGMDGGEAIEGYRVYYDQGINTYIVAAASVTPT